MFEHPRQVTPAALGKQATQEEKLELLRGFCVLGERQSRRRRKRKE
jgi:hypothetical protein